MMLFDRVKEAAADLRRSGREEIEKAKQAGVPAFYSDGEGIVREMPDGLRERVVIGPDGHEIVLGSARPGSHHSLDGSGSGM